MTVKYKKRYITQQNFLNSSITKTSIELTFIETRSKNLYINKCQKVLLMFIIEYITLVTSGPRFTKVCN